MPLWVDKVSTAQLWAGKSRKLPEKRALSVGLYSQYRPNSFDKFVVHKDIADNLKKLVSPRIRPRNCCGTFVGCKYVHKGGGALLEHN